MITKKYDFFDEEDVVYALCEEGALSYVRQMLYKNPELIRARGPYKRNLLFAAVYSGNTELLRFLLDFYKTHYERLENFVNEKDTFGHIALHEAISLDKVEMVKLLLENRADPTIPLNLEIDELKIIHFAREILGEEKLWSIVEKYILNPI